MIRHLYILIFLSGRLFAQDSTNLTIKYFLEVGKPGDYRTLCLDINSMRYTYQTDQHGQLYLKVPRGKHLISTCNPKIKADKNHYIKSYSEKEINAINDSLTIELINNYDTVSKIELSYIDFLNLKGDFSCTDSTYCLNKNGQTFGVMKTWYCALIETGDLYIFYAFDKIIFKLYQKIGFYELETPIDEKRYRINDEIDLHEAITFCKDNTIDGILKPIKDIRYKKQRVH